MIKDEIYDVFFVHKRTKGIICELIYTNNIFQKSFISIIKEFKQAITSNIKSDFLNFLTTYDIKSRSLLFCLFYFFELKHKKFWFPFYFKFELHRNDGKFSLKTKLFEFILNLELFFI